MPTRDVIVIGGSAGGVSAVADLVRSLPRSLPAAIFVTLHVAPDSRGFLPDILDRIGTVPARMAKNGDAVSAGRILVAPPDRHLSIGDGAVRISAGPRVNRFRPSIDVLFRSAAESHGARVAGVLLSGMLDDGTHGLQTIKEHGGVAIVQDAEEAMFAGMPRSAIDRVAVDHVLGVAEIAALLDRLARTSASARRGGPPMSRKATERRPRSRERTGSGDDGGWLPGGVPALYGCPDCGGVLLEAEEGGVLRFRCRIGHDYAAESLLTSQEDRLEDALWTAVRSLEEGAATRRRMATRVAARGATAIGAEYEKRAREALLHAATLRSILDTGVRREAAATQPPPSRRRMTDGSRERRSRVRR